MVGICLRPQVIIVTGKPVRFARLQWGNLLDAYRKLVDKKTEPCGYVAPDDTPSDRLKTKIREPGFARKAGMQFINLRSSPCSPCGTGFSQSAAARPSLSRIQPQDIVFIIFSLASSVSQLLILSDGHQPKACSTARRTKDSCCTPCDPYQVFHKCDLS